MPGMKVPLEVGAVLESRSRRGDGTALLVEIVELSGREAVVIVKNPRRGRPGKRLRVPVIIGVGCGRGGLANYKIVRRADGSPVVYPREVV